MDCHDRLNVDNDSEIDQIEAAEAVLDAQAPPT